ncbi:MAG: DegT/DnrJ/EryC1/StrS family aminotransferase [Anaerovoracaceae bacterium]
MIKLIKPYITYSEVEQEFKEIFASGMFTKGKYSKELPEQICKYTGALYAFNTSSATTAISICLDVIGVGEGDEVIVSDFSFPASVNVIENCGAKPVFADVSIETFNMLPHELETKISSKTKAVIFVSALGNPSGIDEIYEICKKHDIHLIDDAACAIGSEVEGIKSGNLADFSCFSFHPRKLLTAGEGGAITTKHKAFAEKLEILLQHGAKISEKGFDFIEPGYNYRLPEMQGLMIIKQLEKLDKIVDERVAIQREMTNAISNIGYTQQERRQNVNHNIQSLVYRVPQKVDRDKLIAYLYNEGVESTIGTYCLSDCTYYKNKYNQVQKIAKYLQNNTITLPCYRGMDVEYIAERIANYERAK